MVDKRAWSLRSRIRAARPVLVLRPPFRDMSTYLYAHVEYRMHGWNIVLQNERVRLSDPRMSRTRRGWRISPLSEPPCRRTSDVPQHRTRHGAAPEHLLNWIEANRADMPVSNKYLYDGQDFFAMCIAGPNARNDFHITDSEEFFCNCKVTLWSPFWRKPAPGMFEFVKGRPS